MGNICCQT